MTEHQIHVYRKRNLDLLVMGIGLGAMDIEAKIPKGELLTQGPNSERISDLIRLVTE